MLALVLLTSAPVALAPEPERPAGVRISVTATAEIVRAGTSAEREDDRGAPRRQVRRRRDGRSTVEFE